ncbi:MAG: hypothetical protein ABI461_19530 [Polyangiaceae bacterium]
MSLTDERRSAVREKAIAEIPNWYSRLAHLLFPSAVGIATIVFSILQLHDVKT